MGRPQIYLQTNTFDSCNTFYFKTVGRRFYAHILNTICFAVRRLIYCKTVT